MNLIPEHRLNKLRYYPKAFFQHWFVPDGFYRRKLTEKLSLADQYNPKVIADRVAYYNQMESKFELSVGALELCELKPSEKSAYYYDYRAVMRYFPKEFRANYKFMDVSGVVSSPVLVKSRPISDSANNIILKLNSVRHFLPIQDHIPFERKKDMLVWRGAAWKPNRRHLLKAYWNHPLCDVGQVNVPKDDTPVERVKSKLSIQEQLRYKFILSVEGNDVATNLKWIAQSNSLCFMTKPTCETWMMEGRLEAGKHYVELRSDFSDLPEKVEYYSRNGDESQAIIRNLRAYYQQFADSQLEELISLKVVEKYFEQTGQL